MTACSRRGRNPCYCRAPLGSPPEPPAGGRGRGGWASGVLMKTKPGVTGQRAAVSSAGECLNTHTHGQGQGHINIHARLLVYSYTAELSSHTFR